MFGARCRGRRTDDSHRQSTDRQQPGKIGDARRLGVACGPRECGEHWIGGKDVVDDGRRVRRSVTEPGGELPLGDRVGDRRKVPHPSEVQLPRCRGEDVGVGDEDVGPSRLDGAFRACDDKDASVGNETVDAAGGLDRDVTAAGALSGHLRDVRERPGADGDQQPVRTDLADRTLDRLFVGANSPGAELDHGAAEVAGQSIHDRPGRRAVRPAVAEDHRRDRTRIVRQLSLIALSNTDSPMRTSTLGRPA